MNVQVGSGLTPPDKPDSVPDAVEMVCKHSDEEESRRFFAEDLIRDNMPLYVAITDAQFKETGHHLIWDLGLAAKALLRWATFADSIGQFKEHPIPTLDVSVERGTITAPITQVKCDDTYDS